MSSAETLVVTTLQEDEELLFAVGQTVISSVPLVLKAAMELGILELFSESSAQLSPTQIASRLSIKNPDATVTIDRMLRLLVSYCFLLCTLAQDKAGRPERLYALGPKSKFLVSDQERNVAMWFLFLMDKVSLSGWYVNKWIWAVTSGGICHVGWSKFSLLSIIRSCNNFSVRISCKIDWLNVSS